MRLLRIEVPTSCDLRQPATATITNESYRVCDCKHNYNEYACQQLPVTNVNCNSLPLLQLQPTATTDDIFPVQQEVPSTATVNANSYQRTIVTIANSYRCQHVNCSDRFEVSGIHLNQNIVAKKLVMNRARSIPTAKVPSVSRE